MKSTYFKNTACAIALFLAFGSVVSAEETSVTTDVQITANSSTVNATGSADIKIEVRDRKGAVIQNIKARQIEGKTQIEIKREEDKERLKESIKEKQVERKENMTEKREEVKTKQEDRREKIKADVKIRIEKHARIIITRMNAAIDRVEKLTLRIESRIAKLEASGTITTEAKTHIATSKLEIAAAKSDAAKLPGALSEALASTSPKIALEVTFKSLTESIKDHLNKAHRSLEAAVQSIKGRINVQATTTAETTLIN